MSVLYCEAECPVAKTANDDVCPLGEMIDHNPFCLPEFLSTFCLDGCRVGPDTWNLQSNFQN